MSEFEFMLRVGEAVVAALAGGLIARLVRMPVLIGYLIAGIVVGPHTPGFFADEETVNAVARFGVAMLMFAVGVQTSLKELEGVRQTALVGGGIQILGTILLGMLAGLALGWGAYGGLFLGCALSLSSTAVVLRILEERGELNTGHGTAMLGILVVQDLAVVAMVAILPALAMFTTEGMNALAPLGMSLLKGVLFVAALLVVAQRVVPVLLEWIARTGSRELFLLTAVCICMAAGWAAHALGLSLELGAFLAGLVVSEEYAHEVFAQVRPLRDLFASLFFVSVGMLLDPAFIVRHWEAVLAVSLVILLGKSLLSAMGLYLLGWHGRTAIIAGLGLANIGEFSFLLATIGTRQALIPSEIASVILSAALVTILLAPFVYTVAETLYARLNLIPALSRFLNRQGRTEAFNIEEARNRSRALVLGAGRVGRYVSNAFTAQGIPHLIVDYDANAVDRMRKEGMTVVYGDASSPEVLNQLSPKRAEIAVVALPEAATTEKAVRELKQINPDLLVLARVHRGTDIPRMRDAGADMVIHAEFEAGVVMIQQSLNRLGVGEKEVTKYIDKFRQFRYRQEARIL
ncbi:MAG: cation:proton antiporter [Armatimonadetes bacterium]|nr:cation:proton antiporter [Armatimonadota bacterium]